MNKQTYDSVPDVLSWQGEDVFLAEITEFCTIKGSPTRFVFVNKAGRAKVMQWQFPNNPTIDWERLEAENKEAPKKNEVVDGRSEKWRLYSKTYRAEQKSKIVAKVIAANKKA